MVSNRGLNFSLILFLCLLFLINEVHGQTVTEKFDKLDLSENFDTSSGLWTFMANNENLFLVQEGEYILNRKSTEKPFAIIANYDYQEPAFKLVASIKIERATDQNGSIGVIFMAQNDGKGGFVFEINIMKQYRLRQITATGTYKYLTGDAKNGGWIKSNLISELNNYNLIEIKTANRNYDLFINNTFVLSFSELAYKTGRFGLIVGPGSRAKIDFLYLFSSSKFSDKVTLNENGETGKSISGEAGPDIIELAESIIKLKTQINRLQSENDEVKKSLEAMKAADQEDENDRKAKEKALAEYQKKLVQKDNTIDSLQKVNKGLLKYKEMVAGNENADLVISLSKAMKTEKEKNKVLTDSLAMLKNEVYRLKANGNKNSTAPVEKKDSTAVKPKSEFILPNDN
jgi:uncharacterized small protein (DUF1192 family)